MLQDVHIKLNPGLPEQKQHQQEDCSFHRHIGLTFEKETSKVLHLEYNFL